MFKRRRWIVGGGTALAALCAFPTYAQSNLTLYGLVDDSLAYVSNQKGGRTFMQFAGDAQADRWGMFGQEDLGGGYKAIFRLENGFSVNNGALGQGGLEFGRQAYVGLSHSSAGSLTLGRQYDFVLDFLCPTANGCASSDVYAFHLGDYDRLGGERVDNAVKYMSPDIGGLHLGAMYSFGNQPGSLSRNSAMSFGGGYRRGDFQIGAAYTQIRNFVPIFDLGTPVFGASLAGTAIDRYGTGGVGVSYSFGALAVRTVATFVDFRRANQSAILRTAEAGLTYQVSHGLWLSADYAYTKMQGDHWNQIGLVADYFLSKRTDLYVHLNTIRSSADVHAALFPLAPSSTDTQSVASIGIRHKF
ncbi:porin [Paraburkholderia rhynchosiae]|uniref:Porin n=1 Tax=Paraburkholderia rhynchosiae TaxID=487049 RepID=A0A2N7W7X1_9BURK|nr:porin [Paraburkholderia rhynchosiae]PMS25498.1 porin [Paraburkholderia rhynchosiae]CAB3733820.1 Outer membrane porin protein [Paraburkholderia rhynchosiae]